MSKPINMVSLFISRSHIIRGAAFLILSLLFVLISPRVFAEEELPGPPTEVDELDEELRWLKAETYVITPSRIPEKIKKTASSITAPGYFRFTGTHGKDRFVIKLVEASKIEHARRILRGEETSRVHVRGTIVKEPAEYNPGWSYHLAPESIDFFEFAIEVCDAAIQYVEEHLDEVGGSFLPGSHWCPWSSRLVDELKPKES